MKHIPILRTRRITVQLKHLSIGDAMDVAGMPVHLEQAESTKFLNAAIDTVSNGPLNPLDWTVQERAIVVAHYLASTSEDDPNFLLGDNARYLDYLDGGIDYPAKESIDIGIIEDDSWFVRHLTGRMAESIERLVGEIPIPINVHWIIGGMAAQLYRDMDNINNVVDGAYDEWLLNRMRVFMKYPETPFEQLLIACETGRKSLYHLIDYTFDSKRGGIIFLPKGGSELLPPARFPVSACLSELARTLVGKYE